jgi:serralysin
MDSQEFTVVTYTDYVGDTNTGSFDSGVIDWAQTYMQLDIAAMQFLYGANYATAGEVWSGDSTYTFSATTGEMSINETGQGTPAGNRIFRTIWDGDGVDTYDLCNYTTALVIDLTPGGWSVFSATQLADLNKNSTDTAFNARGNIANALLVDEDQRALIENAIGGTVGDLLYGNDADNRLVGRGGDDILFGGNSQDTLLGNAGVDTLHGELGDDRLNGGSGGDKLFGNGGQDWLTGKGGTDRLNGGLGKDRLEGGYGKDQLFGKAGNDRMFGDGGEDILVGGLGKDIMFGGLGADTFRFDAAADSESANGIDVIKDFQVGSDVLDLSELVAGPFALSLGGSFTGTGPSVKTVESGGNTSVAADLDGNGTVDFRVTLQGTTGLTVDDFIL